MNSKNNKGIFYGLLSVMVFGVLSLRAAAQINPEMALFRRAIGTWSAGKMVKEADKKGSSYVAPDFNSVVAAFKAISFERVNQAQAFAEAMGKAYALTEAEKTELMDANESFKALIAQPEVQAVLAKENPGFWNSWLGLLGKIIQAVGKAASAGASAVSNAASAGASAVSNAASAGASAVADRVYGRTKVLNLSTRQLTTIANPGSFFNRKEYDNYVIEIKAMDHSSLLILLDAIKDLFSNNQTSDTVTELDKEYMRRYFSLLPVFIANNKGNYTRFNDLLTRLIDIDRQDEAERVIKEYKIDLVLLEDNLKEQKLLGTSYGEWLSKQFGCFDRVKKIFGCSRKP